MFSGVSTDMLENPGFDILSVDDNVQNSDVLGNLAASQELESEQNEPRRDVPVMKCFAAAVCLVLAGAPNTSASDGFLKQDAKSLVRGENFYILALGLGIAGTVHTWDNNCVGKLDKIRILDVTDLTNLYGSSMFNLSASLLAWSAGKATNNRELASISGDAFRTLVYTQAVVDPIKRLVGRERPDGSNYRSFPSGHTANSFALAELFRRHYGWKIGAPLYTLGALTAAGRMEENVHYLSDVVAGAAIGYVIGRSVNLSGRSPVSVTPYGRGLSVSLAF